LYNPDITGPIILLSIFTLHILHLSKLFSSINTNTFFKIRTLYKASLIVVACVQLSLSLYFPSLVF